MKRSNDVDMFPTVYLFTHGPSELGRAREGRRKGKERRSGVLLN